MIRLAKTALASLFLLTIIQWAQAGSLLERNQKCRRRIAPFAAVYSEKLTIPASASNTADVPGTQQNVWGQTDSSRKLIYAICGTGYYAEPVKSTDKNSFSDDSVVLVRDEVSYESASGGTQGLMREHMAAYGQEHPLQFMFAPRIGQKLSELFPLGDTNESRNELHHASRGYRNDAHFVEKEGLTLLDRLTESGPEYTCTTSVQSWIVYKGHSYPSKVVEQLNHLDGSPVRTIEYDLQSVIPFKKKFSEWTGWKENALVITDHGEYLYQNGRLVPDPRYSISEMTKLRQRFGVAAIVIIFAAIPFWLVFRREKLRGSAQRKESSVSVATRN
jgi:hypothetical protein